MIELYSATDRQVINIPPLAVRAVDWDSHHRTLKVYNVALRQMIELTDVSGNWFNTFQPIAHHPDFVHLNLNKRRVSVNVRDIEYVTLENTSKVTIQLSLLPNQDEKLVLEGSSIPRPYEALQEIDQKWGTPNNVFAGRGTPLEICIPKRHIHAVKFDLQNATACIFTRVPGERFIIHSNVAALKYDLSPLTQDRTFTILSPNRTLQYILRSDQIQGIIPMDESIGQACLAIGGIHISIADILHNGGIMKHLARIIDQNRTNSAPRHSDASRKKRLHE